MRRYRNNNLKNNARSYTRAIVLFLSLAIAAVTINISLKPIILTMANQYGSAAVAESVNDAVENTFNEEEFKYSDFVYLNYNDSGFVTSAEYNSVKINQLKIALNDNIINKLDSLRASKIKIPIGSVLGDVNLSGRGPNIRIKVVQSSVPEINIISSFESVGINTVKHEILVRITVGSEVYLPPKKSEFTYTQDFVIAQTIIVGNIPSGYADIG